MLSYFLFLLFQMLTFGSLKKIKNVYTVLKMTSLKLNKHGTLLQCKPQKKTTQSGNGNLSLLISMNSTINVNNEKCLL